MSILSVFLIVGFMAAMYFIFHDKEAELELKRLKEESMKNATEDGIRRDKENGVVKNGE